MRELELKFRVHGPFTLPDLCVKGSAVASVTKQRRVTLRAVYYDTADLRLAREGITLRRRTGGGDAGWHLKFPTGQPGERVEHQLPLSGNTIPDELRDLVRGYVRSAPLKAVARLNTTRDAWLLADAAGRELAELVDDTVSVVNEGHVSERFREIEVEAKTATREQLDAVGELLRAAGAVAGEFVPKAVRALGPQALQPPDPPPPGEAGRDDTAALALTAFLRLQVRRLIALHAPVLLDEPDAVHQMRVTARRLRSGLRLLRPLLAGEVGEELRDELAWLAGELGDARDVEVLAANIADQLQRVPVSTDAATAIKELLADEHTTARTRAVAALGELRYVALLDLLVDLATEPPLRRTAGKPASAALPPLVHGAWDRLAKAVGKIGPKTPDADVHRARILAKRVRYAADLCAPVFGDAPKALSKKLSDVQDVLGAHQDAVVAAERLAAFAARRGVSGEVGYALGMLSAMQLDATSDTRTELGRVWREAADRRLRRWFTS